MAQPLTADTVEYVVRHDRTVVEVRGAWNDFARANGAPHLVARAVTGRNLDEFIADLGTRGIYEALLERVLRTGEAILFPYRCDAPDRRRFMEMEMAPQGPDRVRFRSRMTREEVRPRQSLLDTSAPRAPLTLTMCSWCKRLPGPDGRWMEVEDFVRVSDVLSGPFLPRLSHGICPGCAGALDRLTDTGS